MTQPFPNAVRLRYIYSAEANHELSLLKARDSFLNLCQKQAPSAHFEINASNAKNVE